MPRYAEVDFTDAPPAQGGSGGDHIPPGKYVLEITNLAQEAARSTGRPMFTVILKVCSGEGTVGKTIRDNFTIPQTQSDSKYGLQRFHAFLLACGANIKQPQVRLDLDLFTGRRVVGEVYDDEIPPRDNYDARLVSKVSSYFPVSSFSTNGAQTAAPAPAPAPAPAATEADVALLGEPATIGAAPVATADSAQAAEELDDLFAQ